MQTVLLGLAIALLLAVGGAVVPVERPFSPSAPTPAAASAHERADGSGGNASIVGNFSASLSRLIALLGAGGGAILSIAWARVALSWFSHDITKKIQAKDRARDALIGTILFAAALSGIVWGLAQWVLSGSQGIGPVVDITGPVIQTLLFSLFIALTTIINGILLPTYQGLLVPELSQGALFPPLGGGGGSFLGSAVSFSDYLLARLVDPAIVLVALGLGLLYMARSAFGADTVRLEGAIPRLVVAVVLSNIVVPVAGALLSLAGAVFPIVAGFDGGAWQSWTNLAGIGEIGFTWDNGVLTFIVSFALFTIVLLLAVAVALRDALLAFLIVLLPILTLLGAFPTLAPLTRRAWLLFIEAAFWPCLVVIPLELAVGSPSALLLLADMALALGSPALLSLAGAQLSQIGFPSGGNALVGGIQRGLGFASLGATSYLRPLTAATTRRASVASQVGGTLSAAGRLPLPLAAPVAVGELLGRGASRLLRHLPNSKASGDLTHPVYRRFIPVHREG